MKLTRKRLRVCHERFGISKAGKTVIIASMLRCRSLGLDPIVADARRLAGHIRS